VTSLADDDRIFLRAAYEEALAGYREGGLPIGALLVHRGTIVGRGRNRRVQEGNPILHAEMHCYQTAGRLPADVYAEATIYTTLSPCYMCGGTTLLFGVPRMVVGENRTIHGADEWLQSQGIEIVLADDPDCYALMQRFVAEKPEVWAEDIGNAGTHDQYSVHRK
jgi:cytosine deaminase